MSTPLIIVYECFDRLPITADEIIIDNHAKSGMLQKPHRMRADITRPAGHYYIHCALLLNHPTVRCKPSLKSTLTS
jgi:hypothetical protein